MKLAEYLSRFARLKILYERVKQDFLSKGLVHHDWNHILRDLARGIIVGEAEGANMEIVLASVLLHDIGRLYPLPGKDHHTRGGEIAPRYLEDAGFTPEEVDQVVHCIRAHGPRGLEEPETLEAKVVYDVNILSCSVGYVGVARVFSYFMREEGLGVEEMMAVPSGRRGPRRDFYTRTGRTTGEEGLQKAREFWEGLRKELGEEERDVKAIVPEYEGD